MLTLLQTLHAMAVGAMATALLDLWLFVLNRLGVPGASFAMIGRWVGHLGRGRVTHVAIAKASPVSHELALGWATHYGVGMVFAGVLLALCGPQWAQQPSLLPALGFGVATVVLPLFVMQPAMGAGFAARRTPAPLKNCLRSLASHAVFGFGLYLGARLLSGATP